MTEKKQSISAIREMFAAASETELPALYLEYEEDSRAGVQNLIQKYQKQEEALKKERERTEQMKIYEHKYEDLGWICGIDEVGRGPLAGPVVAGAVILPRNSKILYLNVPIIKGDAKSVSIAAASIVAKVTRDRLMEEYDKVLPGYGFASNKGYGSAEHIAALKEIGPSPIHRQSFIGHFV